MAGNDENRGIDHPSEPDLAPFMNMVIILIPMLLLSVVFIEISVINVTMPLGGSSTTDEEQEEDKEKLDLSITLATEGFYVTAAGEQEEPLEGCPTTGPTICLEDDSVDTEAAFKEAREETLAGNETRGEERLKEGLQAYDYRRLYNLLTNYKEDFPDETTVRLTADSDIPFALTTRVMDVARYRLEEAEYEENEAFWKADPQTETTEDGEEQYVNLFGDPAFAVHQ